MCALRARAGLGRRNVADGFVLNQSTHSRVANSAASNCTNVPSPDHVGFEGAINGFGESFVVAAAGRLDSGLGQALGVVVRYILHVSVVVIDEAVALYRPSIHGGLFEGIE